MSYRHFCFDVYWKLRARIAPTLRYSQTIYESVLKDSVKADCRWLDLGCGHQLLPPWRYKQERQLIEWSQNVVGLDYDFESLKLHQTFKNKIRGDISHLPFEEDCFDLVTSNMVFEHLKDPTIQMKEVYRVLKPGGTLLFLTPNTLNYGTLAAKLVPENFKNKIIWLLQRRKEEDVFPAYYRINTQKDIKRFSILSGFEVEQIKMICSDAQFVMIPPLVILELFLIRVLMKDRMKAFRANIIVKLKKPNVGLNLSQRS